MIYIGTSGYSYKDWQGYFYPENLPASEYLSFYTNHFDAVELNFSYYKMPSASQLDKMVEQTQGKLLFSIKAHQNITHQRTAGPSQMKQFYDALSPLISADVLGAVLLQFPHSFHQTEANRHYLKFLVDTFELPLVAEFRSEQWAAPAIAKWLKQIQIGYCCVDQPQLPGLMPKTAHCTCPTAYVRFHGRNSEKWYQHNHAYERYDYRYNAQELRQWIPSIQSLDSQAEKTLVFFNNHFQAKAIDGAKQLSQMLQSIAASKKGHST